MQLRYYGWFRHLLIYNKYVTQKTIQTFTLNLTITKSNVPLGMSDRLTLGGT